MRVIYSFNEKRDGERSMVCCNTGQIKMLMQYLYKDYNTYDII